MVLLLHSTSRNKMKFSFYYHQHTIKAQRDEVLQRWPVFDCPDEIASHEDRRRSLRGCSLLERWRTGSCSWPEGSIPAWWGEGRRRPQLARSCPRTYIQLNAAECKE